MEVSSSRQHPLYHVYWTCLTPFVENLVLAQVAVVLLQGYRLDFIRISICPPHTKAVRCWLFDVQAVACLACKTRCYGRITGTYHYLMSKETQTSLSFLCLPDWRIFIGRFMILASSHDSGFSRTSSWKHSQQVHTPYRNDASCLLDRLEIVSRLYLPGLFSALSIEIDFLCRDAYRWVASSLY